MWQGYADDFAKKWLQNGDKYAFSANYFKHEWTFGIEESLNQHGLTLAGCKTLEDVSKVFSPWVWKGDPFFQLFDVVKPPVVLMREGGEDCDGWAMAHSLAVQHVLGPQGWKAYNISYYAKPWWNSHHFSLCEDPSGRFWAVQPEPTDNADDGKWPKVFGPFIDIPQAVKTICSMYKDTTVEWYDVRTPMWDLVHSAQPLAA